MLKLFTISYGFLSVLGQTERRKKKIKRGGCSSQRREDAPVGLSLEPEDGGEKTFMDSLLHRELVLLPSGRRQGGLNAADSPSWCGFDFQVLAFFICPSACAVTPPPL